MANRSKQITDTLLMVRPVDFCFNEETAVDNEFQQKPSESQEEINARAMAEFENMVNQLRQEEVNVLILEQGNTGIKTPDAVFPNNWISTEANGNIITYPMATPNRRAEKLRLTEVELIFSEHGYSVSNIINIGRLNEEMLFLEGTGSLIIDHGRRIVYVAESVRSHPEQLENFKKLLKYDSLLFRAFSSNGFPIYHTNVIMSVGIDFAVVCSTCIPDSDEKALLIDSLSAKKDLIEISMEQMEKSFCANILQIKSILGVPLIVMSETAFQGFTDKQLRLLETHGKIIKVEIPTIEKVGGGSVRCMMAEIFLPKSA